MGTLMASRWFCSSIHYTQHLLHNLKAMSSSSPPSLDISPKAIDIQQALTILSARTEDPKHTHNHDGCCHGARAPENAKDMGQTIDMVTPTPLPASEDIPNEEEQKKLQEERARRRQEIHSALERMKVRELLQAVMKAQQDRVAAYRDYEGGLTTVLQTGNMTTYPDTCAKATALFSVLSETVKKIQEILMTRKRKELSRLLGQLQSNEKEMLHLTAACHLERIRQHNHELVAGDSDPRAANLLKEGVVSLKQKIAACIENINEVLDEIRMALLDEEE